MQFGCRRSTRTSLATALGRGRRPPPSVPTYRATESYRSQPRRTDRRPPATNRDWPARTGRPSDVDVRWRDGPSSQCPGYEFRRADGRRLGASAMDHFHLDGGRAVAGAPLSTGAGWCTERLCRRRSGVRPMRMTATRPDGSPRPFGAAGSKSRRRSQLTAPLEMSITIRSPTLGGARRRSGRCHTRVRRQVARISTPQGHIRRCAVAHGIGDHVDLRCGLGPGAADGR